jgi:uncharacterized protein (TIGR02453 family)
MTFTGFSDATLTFLANIEKHNDKVWFDHHRQDYEAHWLAPAVAFVEAIGPGLKKLDSEVTCLPKVNGSIFRLHRDVRFSRDKRPYKDHLDMWFWAGPKKKEAASGFFFRLKKDHVVVGVGNHTFDKDRLARYREQVADPTAGKALLSALKKVEKAGYEAEGEHYKKPPRGYDVSGPRAPLMRHNALYVHQTLPITDDVRQPSLINTCLAHYKKMLPVHQWLKGALAD